MTERDNQTDAYLEAVRETVFEAERETPRKRMAIAGGVRVQFVGAVVGGLRKCSLGMFLGMWADGPVKLTDRLARLMERLNPAYRITRAASDACVDPEAEAADAIRKGVDFREAIRRARAAGGIDAGEMAEIEAEFDALIEKLRRSKDQCVSEHRQRQQQQQGGRNGQNHGPAAGRNVGGAGRPRARI